MVTLALRATETETGVSAYYTALNAAAMAAYGSVISGNLTPVQAGGQGDFAYYYYNNTNNSFNQWTYNYISPLVQAGSYAGAAQLGSAGSFPLTYLELINKIAYQLSPQDQQALTNATNNATQQANNLVSAWVGIFGPITQPQLQQAKAVIGGTPNNVDYILGYQLGSVWSGKTPPLTWQQMMNAQNLQQLLPNMPPSGQPILGPVTQYLNALSQAVPFQDEVNFGNWQLNQVKVNLNNANLGSGSTPGNAGMVVSDPQTGNTLFVPAYQIDKSAQQIVNDLNGSSEITMSLQVQAVSQSQYNVSINGGTSFSFGGPLVTFSGSAGASYNMESIQGAGSSLNINLTYKGYSLVPIAPQSWSDSALPNGGTPGWYAPSIIQEAYQNSSSKTPVSGFIFESQPVQNLSSYPTGGFNLLSNVLLTNYPSISIEYTNGNYSLFESAFSAQASGTVKLFGFIPLGGASMSQYQSTLVQGSSNSQFTVNFTPPSTSGVPTYQQTAYVLGGVVVSPAVTG